MVIIYPEGVSEAFYGVVNLNLSKCNCFVPAAGLLWCCSPAQTCPGGATRVESVSAEATSPSKPSPAQTRAATLSGTRTAKSKSNCVSTSEVRGDKAPRFALSKPDPVYPSRSTSLSGCCCYFPLSGSALLVRHNGFLKAQMLMGWRRIMHLRRSAGG